MGHNPTVDDGEDPGPPKTDPTERCISSHGQNSFSTGSAGASIKARGHVQVRQQSPRSVRARTMGSGFSTDAVAVQAILDARPHLFVHLV